MSYPPIRASDDPEIAQGLINGGGGEDGEDVYPKIIEGQSLPRGEEAEEEEDAEDSKDLVRRYEDFSTVDWIQDALHERTAPKTKSPRPNSINAKLSNLDGLIGRAWRLLTYALEEGQTWVVITLVGIAIGVSAALISIITVWLSDMKMGYCTTGWWLSQKFCCLEISDEGEGCSEWRNWGGVEPFRWIFYILFAALFSSSAAFLVRCFAPYAAGSGISEIKCILGGFIIKGFLGAETFFIKGITLPLAIASGLSVGKEGPSVHVACAIGHVVAKLFHRYNRSQLKMREIVTASSAAGVAVAFGSPIGGVLFSIEEMNQVFFNRTMWQSFVCALVATFTLASMDPFRTGKLVLFQVSYDRDWHYFEIPAYIIIGVFGGLYGAFVIKFNLQMAAFRRKHLAGYAVSEAVTLAVITAFIGYLNRFLRIDMTEMMEMLFRECEGGGDRDGLCQSSAQWRMVNSLLLATVVRTVLIVVSYGCKVPCGIFVPSMAVGALFGRMVGILVKALQTAHPTAAWFSVCAPDAPCITPGTYAFLGAAAALGGVTRLTVTVVVIMFELTGALTYLLPVMITILVTKAVSDQFGGHGIADRMIRFNGYPYLEQEDKEDSETYFEPIANVMKSDIIMMYASGMPLQTIGEIVQSTNYQGFPVVQSENDKTIVGFVGKTELRYAFDKARRTRHLSPNATCTFHHMSSEPSSVDHPPAQPDIVIPLPHPPQRQNSHGRSPTRTTGPRLSGVEAERVDFGQYVDEVPLTVASKMPLEIVMQLFRRMGPRVILVTDQGRLVGLVTIKDVLRHEARHEVSHQRKKRAAANLSPSGGGSRTDSPIPSAGGVTQRNQPDGHWRNESTSSSLNGWNNSWVPVEDTRGNGGNGLEVALEEGLKWAKQRLGPLASSILRIPGGSSSRRRGGNGNREPPPLPLQRPASTEDHQEAYQFELGDDEP